MDAEQALADLVEISSQIQAAVVFDEQGKVAGSTLADPTRADELAGAVAELLRTADGVKTGESPLTQLEAATGAGSVFVVRVGNTSIAATTGADPTVGLVFYDLKSALRNIEAAEQPVHASGPGASEEPGGSPAKKRAPAARKAPARKPAARKKKDAP